MAVAAPPAFAPPADHDGAHRERRRAGEVGNLFVGGGGCAEDGIRSTVQSRENKLLSNCINTIAARRARKKREKKKMKRDALKFSIHILAAALPPPPVFVSVPILLLFDWVFSPFCVSVYTPPEFSFRDCTIMKLDRAPFFIQSAGNLVQWRRKFLPLQLVAGAMLSLLYVRTHYCKCENADCVFFHCSGVNSLVIIRSKSARFGVSSSCVSISIHGRSMTKNREESQRKLLCGLA